MENELITRPLTTDIRGMIMRKMIMIAVLAAVGMAVFGQEIQRLGLTDSDTIAKLGSQLNADYVVSGHTTNFRGKKLVSISIIDVKTFQQIAGDYREYEQTSGIRALLPDMAKHIIAATRGVSTGGGLAVLPLTAVKDVEQGEAEFLAQILATELANGHKYAVLPRTSTIERVMTELEIQRSGMTDETSIKAIGAATNAQYVLSGTITNLGDMNLFDVKIFDVENGRVIAGTDIEYRNLEDGIDIMCKLAYDLTGVKTERYLEIEARETDRAKAETARKTKQRNLDVWANSRFYAGLRVGVSPRFYGLSDDISTGKTETGASFEAALQGSVHALSLSVGSFDIEIGGQMELWFGMDAVSYSGTDSAGDFSASFTSSSLTIPLLAKAWFFRSPERVVVSAFADLYFSIPLGELEYTSGESSDSYKVNIPAGWLIGLSPGIRLGPGTLFADIRYGKDFGRTSISDNNGVLSIYSRGAFSFALGYEVGFIER